MNEDILVHPLDDITDAEFRRECAKRHIPEYDCFELPRFSIGTRSFRGAAIANLPRAGRLTIAAPPYEITARRESAI